MAKLVSEIGTTPIGTDSGPKIQVTAAISAIRAISRTFVLLCFCSMSYHLTFILSNKDSIHGIVNLVNSFG